jgi:hypothetical protein
MATTVRVAVPTDFPSLGTLAGKGAREIEKLMQDFATAHKFSYHTRHPKKEPGYVRFTCAACSSVRDPAAPTSKRRKVEPTGDSNDSQSSATGASALPRIHAVRIGYTPHTGAIDECWVESAHWSHRCGVDMAQQPPSSSHEPAPEPPTATRVQLLVNLMHSRLDYAILSLGIYTAAASVQTPALSAAYEHLITFRVQRRLDPAKHGEMVNAALARVVETPLAGSVITDVAVVTSVVDKVYSTETCEESEFIFLKFFIKLQK